MAGTPPGASQGLSSQQLQQIISQAVGTFGSGQNTGVLNQNIMSALQSAGASPSQISALASDGLPQGGQGSVWGNGAPETQRWIQQVMGAENQSAQATNPASTPDPAASANQNAVANGGVATTQQQLQNLFQPTYMQTPTSGSATQYTGSVDPSASIQQIYSQLNPQFAQANRNLNNQLAASGIEGGSAIDAQQQLQSAETGTTASAIQAAIQNAQGLNQQAGLTNTNAQNQFNLQNLQNLYSTNSYNTNAANTGQQQYANALLGQYNTDANSFNGLNTSQFGTQNNLTYQNLAANQNLAGNLAGNYQVQQGAGAGAAAVGNGLGQYFQNQLTPPVPGTSPNPNPSLGTAGKATAQ